MCIIKYISKLFLNYKSNHFKNHVNSLIVLSAPQLNTHGSVGWKVTPKIPKSEQSSCSLSNFNGTTNGFWSKSLKIQQKIEILINKTKKIKHTQTLTYKPFREKQLKLGHQSQMQTKDNVYGKQQNVQPLNVI